MMKLQLHPLPPLVGEGTRHGTGERDDEAPVPSPPSLAGEGQGGGSSRSPPTGNTSDVLPRIVIANDDGAFLSAARS